MTDVGGFPPEVKVALSGGPFSGQTVFWPEGKKEMWFNKDASDVWAQYTLAPDDNTRALFAHFEIA